MSFRMRISTTTQCHNPKLGSLFRHGDNQIMNRNALWLLMLVALLIGMLSMYMPGRATYVTSASCVKKTSSFLGPPQANVNSPATSV